MKAPRKGVTWIALLCAVVLVAGGTNLISPASAKGSINWNHIWKTQIKPRADHRYYTKAKARARFATISMLGNYYSKTDSDARYAFKSDLGNYYTKAQSDAKYAPFPSVIRGTFSVSGYANAAGVIESDTISFGSTLSAAPTVHFIPAGGTVPAGCAGTAAAPDAAAGNLCVFEAFASNASAAANGRGVYNPATAAGLFNQSAAYGAAAYAYSTTAGSVLMFGTWAVRPSALSASRAVPHMSHSGPGLGR